MSDETTKREETLADIVAELREISKMQTCGYICQEQIAEYAERIEAAHIREVQAEQEVAEDALCKLDEAERRVGNAAKLREALAEMTAFWDAHGCAYSVQVAPVRESKDVVEAERVRVMAKARAALAEPERNCDRFDGDESAWEAYVAEHGGESAMGTMHGPDQADYPTWLFATATPEKGGEE